MLSKNRQRSKFSFNVEDRNLLIDYVLAPILYYFRFHTEKKLKIP